jgi:hypothetical protein
MEFTIEKQDNNLWRNIKAYKQYLNDVPAGRYKVIVEQVDKRSLQQNSWIHAILPEIVIGLREQGYSEVKTPEDAKDVIKALFFKKEVTNGTETIEIIQGTSKASKLDFSTKAEEIIRWASEYLGIDVAPPSEQTEIFK